MNGRGLFLVSQRRRGIASVARLTGERRISCKSSARTYARKLDGRGEAHLIALACSDPPTDARKRTDFAAFVRDLVDGRYKDAIKVVLVMDNLNTHSVASLYEAFEPAEAKRIADKLKIHYTPKHGSWLNMAEIELSALGRQCLDRRIADKATLVSEVAEWEKARNAAVSRIEIKLKRLYPVQK